MKRLATAIPLLLLATSLAAAEPASSAAIDAQAKSIVSRTLKNGLTVIVWPDHDIPSVAMFNTFRVGSRNERPGITGLSHFFEHMMFNGGTKYGPGEFDRIMEAAGGENNASTTENVTTYMDWFPTSALETIFDLEADRIGGLAFDPKMIDSERGVVYSERRSSIDNDNFGTLTEQVQAVAFLAHPYKFPVIGWPSDIEAWTRQDLMDYFHTYYAPNNATLVVAGDVDPERIFALATKYLEPIPAHEPPPPVRTVEPPQLGERRVTIERDAQTPLVLMAFHSGDAKDPQMPALDLLLSALADGDSSRLHRALVEEQQLAVDVSAYRDTSFDPGLTWVSLTVRPGVDPGKAEEALSAELRKVAADGLSDAELQKAKNIRLADFWRNMKTISGKGLALARAAVFLGDPQLLFSTPQRFEAVTKDDVRAVASKVFAVNNRTVGVLVPTATTGTEAE